MSKYDDIKHELNDIRDTINEKYWKLDCKIKELRGELHDEIEARTPKPSGVVKYRANVYIEIVDGRTTRAYMDLDEYASRVALDLDGQPDTLTASEVASLVAIADDVKYDLTNTLY